MPNSHSLQAVLDESGDLYIDHYGVKGMRWGHRKRKVSSSSRTGRNIRSRQNQRKSRREMKRNRRTLSEADLNRNLDRLRKEKQLKELIDEDVNPGKKYIQDVLKKSGDKLLPAALAAGGAYALAHEILKVYQKPYLLFFDTLRQRHRGQAQVRDFLLCLIS